MKTKLWLSAAMLIIISGTGFSQGVVGKLKQKASQVGEQAIDRKVNEKTGINQPGTNQPVSNPSGPGNTPAHTAGGGLVVTPPDVKTNMADAESSFKSGNYSDARYALRQAMLGVEMEIGNSVLKSLPETVSGLKFQSEADQVTSTGYGWIGLTIYREYGSDSKQLNTTIANNAAWMSAVNMYLSNTHHASSGQQNWKQTKVKGYKGIIEYSDGSGYKLSVPIGQSSVIVWEGINFTSEQEMMNAANAFDIDSIKNKLGEK
jgi:hypothetical protein